MATRTPTAFAKDLIAEYGTEIPDDALEAAVASEVESFVDTLTGTLASKVVYLTTPVRGREKAMLKHHGISGDVFPGDVDDIMDALDHTDCPRSGWVAEEGRVVKGCPQAGKPRIS